jgi:ABC-type polysaccharide/polyol phosphate transport system ATPase subunit/ABC-type polysaccharide/polyol phosphate export permease
LERELAIAHDEPHPSPAEAAISLRSLSKTFKVPHQRYTTVRDRIAHPLRRQRDEMLHALRGIDLDVARGEFFGIVGKNGSGKSTLLRCLAGIYRSDGGSVRVTGRVAPFIELGLGFDDEMAARDNAVISAVLLGMRRKEAEAGFEQVLSFAELEEFRDLKLRNYSSGMSMRLAFSVTIHVEAEVFLFDEVLAVGDEAFRRKCFERFGRFREQGKTVVLVTHDMDHIRGFCDRAALLDQGRIVDIGDPGVIADGYDELNVRQSEVSGAPAGRRAKLGSATLAPADSAARRAPLREPQKVSPRRLATLTWTLAVAQFRLRYLDSALSYLWTVARPLALFGVLYFVFSRLGRFDEGVAHYPVYLLTSLVIWTYFVQTTSTSVQSLVHRAPLLRRLPVPHSAIPLSFVLAALFDLGMNMIAVLIFVFAAGITPSLSWLEVPLIVALLSLLTVGLALVLSSLYARLRDVDQIWQVLSQAIFYATPIFYVTSQLPSDLQEPSLFNPIATAFAQVRHAFIDPAAPTAAGLIGGAGRLAIPLGVTAATFVIGLVVFRRQSQTAVERL